MQYHRKKKVLPEPDCPSAALISDFSPLLTVRHYTTYTLFCLLTLEWPGYNDLAVDCIPVPR